MGLRQPYLRDGVDVYVHRDEALHFVFLSTRKRLVLKASSILIQALPWMDGSRTTSELVARFAERNGADHVHQLLAFMDYLEENGVLIEQDWLLTSGLSEQVRETQHRQLNFLLDVLGTPERVLAAQAGIQKAHLVVFGAGAVGSWLLRLLVAMGFRSFVIIDADTRCAADVSRHAYFDRNEDLAVASKTALLAQSLSQDRELVTVRAVSEPLTTRTQLHELISDETTLVVNAADEPYIGYTSVLLSRFCLQRNLPLIVAGGFDAHLGSLGEMIVPGYTPCADCYASHFETALAQWKPVPHPIQDRRKGFGGLCSLSVFAASSAALQILRQVVKENERGSSGRGELLFEDYRLDSFVVERNPVCAYCGRI